MPPKKRGAGLVKGHDNEARYNREQATDEPDAGARANECPLTPRVHAHAHTHTQAHARTHRHTHRHTHTLTIKKTIS